MEEQEHVIFIKNMVCNRCILVVTEMLKDLHPTPLKVELGMAIVQKQLQPADRETIKAALEKYGFELIDDKRMRVIEQIRTAIIELVHYEDNTSKLKLSEYLEEKCHYDYSFLEQTFLRGQRNQYREILYRPESGTDQGIAGLRRTLHQRDSRLVAIFKRGTPRARSSTT